MRRLFLGLMLAAFVGATPSLAAYYGMAGCGLGAMVVADSAERDTKFMQIIAATVNNILVPQTSAITSGTSGCTKGGRGVAADYLRHNRDALLHAAAKGDGEPIAVLSTLYGCDDSAQVARQLKQDFSALEKASDEAALQRAVEQSLTRSATCAHLS